MIIDHRAKNAQRIPCKEFRGECRMCQSGFIARSGVCSGVNPDTASPPDCLRDEVPEHLCQPNGLPLGWGKFTQDSASEAAQ